MSTRKDILNTNDKSNKELFTKLFKEVKGLEEYNPTTGYLNSFLYTHLPNPEYRETDYFGILFTSKGGSSWINKRLKKNELDRLHNPNYQPGWQYAISPYKIHSKKAPNENSGEWRNIINGSSEKDLIVVTRNPVKKWISGLWQEINAMVKLYHKSLDDTEIENLMYKWLVGTYDMEGTLSTAHCRLYNEGYYHLLSSNNINKKKLKIVNIDSPAGDLEKVFSDYWPDYDFSEERFSTHRPKHERLLKILLKICRKQQHIHKHIINIMMNDLYYFNKINSEYKEQLYGTKII